MTSRRVGFVPGDAFFDHVEPAGHPERRARLEAVGRAIRATEGLHPLETVRATDDQLVAVHPKSHLERVTQVAADGGGSFDPDTYVTPASDDVARLAAGSLCHAVDAVVRDEIDTAWSFVRPPGHHATADVPMGFCLYNSVAIAARHAQRAHGVSRVLVLDWDVHHGNGTQAIFWEDPTVAFYSSHQMPLYPGTGSADESGAHDTIVNVPLQAGDGDGAFLEALRTGCGPLIETHAPEVILVSAGFDAHHRDPLSGLQVTAEGFAAATRWVLEQGPPVVFTLEGGYDLQGLEESVAACLRVCRDA
ncbi:MAG: histone deacetylase [Myxococcota bacterium]